MTEDLEQRLGKIPTFRQFIAICLSAISLVAIVGVAVYATSQHRLETCEIRISDVDKTNAVIAETLKRIEQKLDATIQYQEKRELKIDRQMDDIDKRIRYLERVPR